MADFGTFSSGAIGGAEIGTAIAPGIGTLIGGALGGIAGLFGDSPEQQRRKRKDELIRRIREINQQNIASGANLIGAQTQKDISSGRAAAARRAAAMGVTAEPYVGTAESRALEAGGTQLSRYVQAANEAEAQQETAAETGFADRPIEPGISDYLLGLGGSAMQISTGLQAAQARSQAAQTPVQATPTNPVTPAPSGQPGNINESLINPMNFAYAINPSGTSYSDYLKNAGSPAASMYGTPQNTFLPDAGYSMKKRGIMSQYTKPWLDAYGAPTASTGSPYGY